SRGDERYVGAERKQKNDLMVRSRASFTRGVSNHADGRMRLWAQIISMVRDALATLALLTMRSFFIAAKIASLKPRSASRRAGSARRPECRAARSARAPSAA